MFVVVTTLHNSQGKQYVKYGLYYLKNGTCTILHDTIDTWITSMHQVSVLCHNGTIGTEMTPPNHFHKSVKDNTLEYPDDADGSSTNKQD